MVRLATHFLKATHLVLLLSGIQIGGVVIGLLRGKGLDSFLRSADGAIASPKIVSNTTAIPVSSKLSTDKRYKVAIAIVSAFDWQESPPYVSFQSRRFAHRKTIMKHPAVQNGQVLVYFVIGNQKDMVHQGSLDDSTHNIAELQPEMDHYGDIVLLNSSDFHNCGKMNAWYEWAAINVQADYHMKLDDESYVRIDKLLSVIDEAPRQEFVGGLGMRFNRTYNDNVLLDIPWMRGLGYILSNDLLNGLGECSSSKQIDWNNGEHEDVYTAIALRTCGLDKNLTYNSDMNMVFDILAIFSAGCRQDMVDDSLLIHCSGSMRPKTFSKLPLLTFERLDDIYHPRPGDITPSWAKWESLRLLYMDDFRNCHNQTYRHCEGWETHTCKP